VGAGNVVRKQDRLHSRERRPGAPESPGRGTREASPGCTETLTSITVADAARVLREAVKDKSYRGFPLGLEAGHYLRAKRKRLTAESYRDYESCLDKLARHFADLEPTDLEPPVGTGRLEEFLDFQWVLGRDAPTTRTFRSSGTTSSSRS
jgi:hypothetical protein